ncbi:MAG: dihydrofolate reductase [Melioribacteraceae bacterium]|nr:dihydrofolate reductase [Melioribacteraceae bacterium]
MEKIIIAAVSENLVIGNRGRIPWHSAEELKHFKIATSGFPVVMGRKTWDSLKKPLTNRLNVILTRNTGFSFSHSNVVICNTISDAVKFCEDRGEEKIFLIGGEEIFRQTITIADKMIISKMKFKAEGENYFPDINELEWKLETEIDKKDFIINVYKRAD